MRSLFLAGAQRLEDNKELINMLNVFPVPDGDTGTNMSMTLQSAVNEIRKLDQNADMSALCKAISSGSLRGARGNSGVILSQLLRGFTRTIRDEKEPLTAPMIAAAFGRASETADKAVMKPKEGTILTVARAIADRSVELVSQKEDAEEQDITSEPDLVELLADVVEVGVETLKKTPDMLPVLKEAGVVDSGGQGLMEFMIGVLDRLRAGTDQTEDEQGPAITAQEVKDTETLIKKERTRAPISTDDIKFGYCTEFLILTTLKSTDDAEQVLKSYLSTIGDSIVCVGDDGIIKIHVHTNDPGLAIQKALTYGQLSNLKIDNMRLEHENTLVTLEELAQAESETETEAVTEEITEVTGYEAPEPASWSAPEPTWAVEDPDEAAAGFIAVAAGDGMAKLFTELGVDYVIKGGQTMNPSTEDILKAIESVKGDPVYVFPNNKNIILSANQACQLTEDRTVIVVPTKTMPQGISAMIAYDPSLSGDENKDAMADAAAHTKTCEVTFAVRTTKIQGHKIKKGDIMGLDDNGIKASGKNVAEVVMKLLDHVIDDESSVVSLFSGQDVEVESAQELVELISKQYPTVDIDLYEGGQPVYYYILAVD